MHPHLTSIDGRYWRMMFVDRAADLLAPARAAEGRWHYDGQKALYLSSCPDGCIIATARYTTPEGPQRAIYPVRVRSERIVDLRDRDACAYFRIDTTHRQSEWQIDRENGHPAKTWAISDRVRALELDGMLYASRKAPSITHLTLFHWDKAMVMADGAAIAPTDRG